MKTIKFIQATVLLLFSASVSFAAQPDSKKEVIHINSARFATSLVERWASEYEKENPGIEIVISPDSSGEDIDLHFIASENVSDTENVSNTNALNAVNENQSVVYTGRYALLPIANAANPLLNELNRKKLNNKRLEELFFETSFIDRGSHSSEKPKYEVTIYSGNNADSFADLFASHFGYSAADIRGRKISGDDIYLINAVQKDQTSAAFNPLGYIFDLETRELKNGLALIPLDVKRDQYEILKSANIDKTIALLENEAIPLIPVEHIGFVYQSDQIPAKQFLNWVLTEGQKYNREFGFLKTEEEVLAVQLKEIEELRYTASF